MGDRLGTLGALRRALNILQRFYRQAVQVSLSLALQADLDFETAGDRPEL